VFIVLVEVHAQQITIEPRVRSNVIADERIATIDLTPHFVTTIRAPEPVTAVVIGDPSLFQVEHSEHEPELVFLKSLDEKSARSNLLISTTGGRQFAFLLVNHGQQANSSKVDFLFRYLPRTGFFIEPEPLPSALVPQTRELPPSHAVPTARFDHGDFSSQPNQPDPKSLDALLERQKRARMPILYGQQSQTDEPKRDRLRAGISEVIDGGQQVVVLFSVVDSSRRPILLMTPQVQLGGKEKTGWLIKHEHWSTAEQLAVIDFRLSRRRIGPGERADGVVEFERPPYKRSSETLFLQMADSGAVDKPALVPIGFGVSFNMEESNHEQ